MGPLPASEEIFLKELPFLPRRVGRHRYNTCQRHRLVLIASLELIIDGDLKAGRGSPRRNLRPNFRRTFADRSNGTNSLGFVIVGLSRLHGIVNTASAPNEICVDLLVLLALLTTVYVVTLDRITRRITRRNTCVPRKPNAAQLGERGRGSRRRSSNV